MMTAIIILLLIAWIAFCIVDGWLYGKVCMEHGPFISKYGKKIVNIPGSGYWLAWKYRKSKCTD